jgi:HSP90 family molecular chaperone
MSKTWTIGVRRPSTVSDWKKLIGDFRDQFPYDPLTALIVETFANSVDAKATTIEIEVGGHSIYKIIDNGTGMTQEDFEEYHNVASLTKKRGETIGFAGVGAKIFLDRAESITTETRSKSFEGATHWAFYGDSLEWEPIRSSNVIKSKTGTYVSVNITTIQDYCTLFRLEPKS